MIRISEPDGSRQSRRARDIRIGIGKRLDRILVAEKLAEIVINGKRIVSGSARLETQGLPAIAYAPLGLVLPVSYKLAIGIIFILYRRIQLSV